MGYYIQYGKTIVKTAVQTPLTKKKYNLTFVVALLVSTILSYTAYSYKDVLQEYILPGDASVTASALDTLIEDIRQGERIEDAVTAFCLEIIDHADIA